MRSKFTCIGAIIWALAILAVPGSTLYVDVNSTHPTAPYSKLSTAAVAIQTAVNAANNGDLILVNDGRYQTGFATSKPSVTAASDTNRVVINKPVTVQSLNGPGAAIIDGGNIFRCVFLTNGALLSGFTLTHGSAGWVTTVMESGKSVSETNFSDGGAIAGPTPVGVVVSNCVLTANAATRGGGGAFEVTLINCVVTGNQAGIYGGGAIYSELLNCTVSGNQVLSPGIGATDPGGIIGPWPGAGGGICAGSAVNCLIAENSCAYGGGAWVVSSLVNCTIINNSASMCGGIYLSTSGSGLPGLSTNGLTNCVIYFNSAATNANFSLGTLNDCCTFPLPIGGRANFTNNPAFANLAAGDYHLAPNSPLINSGNNSVATNSTDLDGNPRIAGGTVDIGCYEYQTPTSVLSYAWAEQYGLPTDGSADYIDSDGDGLNNWQEFIAGTIPTNAASVLTMYTPTNSSTPIGVKLTWQSVNTRTYYLQRSANLSSPLGFTSIQSNLTGLAGTTSFTDTTATNGNSFFYRVGVQ